MSVNDSQQGSGTSPSISTAGFSGGSAARLDTFVVLLSLANMVAITMHATIGYATLRRPFDADRHAWASSAFSVIARSFAQQGIIALHGVPIANNPPLGTEPDAYIHWPALFTMALSRIFLLFGESEAVARAFALVISAACVITMFFLVRTCCGARVALGASFGFLTLPAFFLYTRLVQATMLAILFEMLALMGFIKGTSEIDSKRWRIIGEVALVLGVFTSWEPLLLPPALIALALFQRDRRRVRLAVAYLAIGAIAFLTVMSLYLTAAPGMAHELWRAVLYRAGSSYAAGVKTALPLHAIPNLVYYTQRLSFADTAALYASFCRSLLGIGPLLMLAFVLAQLAVRKTHARQTALQVGGLLGPWVLWFWLMHNQVVDNDFQMLLAVPPTAVCVGITLAAVHDAIRDRLPGGALPVRVAATAMLAGYLLWPLATAVKDLWNPPPPTGWVQYARDIEQHTPPNAVVLVPVPSMLPVYYSHRHLLRATRDDAVVRLMLSKMDAAFPGSPVFIALPPGDLTSWRESVRQFTFVGRGPYLILLYVGDAGDGRMARAAELLPGDISSRMP